MQVLTSNLDSHPYTDIYEIDGKVRVLTSKEAPYLDKYFDNTPNVEQVTNVTRGNVYQAVRKTGFGDVESITIIGDNGEEYTLCDFFLENVPDDTPLSHNSYFNQLLEQVLASPTITEIEKNGTLIKTKDLPTETTTEVKTYVYTYLGKYFIIVYKIYDDGTKECVQFTEMPETEIIKSTDEMFLALQDEHQTIQYVDSDTNVPLFIVFGKSEISRTYNSDKEPVIESCYSISENTDVTNPDSDFSIHYIHHYDDVKKFINKHFDISYKELAERFAKDKSEIIKNNE